MKQCLQSIFLFCLVGCATDRMMPTDNHEHEMAQAASESEVPFSQKIYYFQHQLIGEWVFDSDGAFFFDLINGNVARFLDAATQMLDSEYAEGIAIRPLVDHQAVLLIFPTPEAAPNCYFALIKKEGEQYQYYTYEKTLNLWQEPYYGVVGSWDAEGNHENHGPRHYQTEQAFLDDMLPGSPEI